MELKAKLFKPRMGRVCNGGIGRCEQSAQAIWYRGACFDAKNLDSLKYM